MTDISFSCSWLCMSVGWLCSTSLLPIVLAASWICSSQGGWQECENASQTTQAHLKPVLILRLLKPVTQSKSVDQPISTAHQQSRVYVLSPQREAVQLQDKGSVLQRGGKLGEVIQSPTVGKQAIKTIIYLLIYVLWT